MRPRVHRAGVWVLFMAPRIILMACPIPPTPTRRAGRTRAKSSGTVPATAAEVASLKLDARKHTSQTASFRRRAGGVLGLVALVYLVWLAVLSSTDGGMADEIDQLRTSQAKTDAKTESALAKMESALAKTEAAVEELAARLAGRADAVAGVQSPVRANASGADLDPGGAAVPEPAPGASGGAGSGNTTDLPSVRSRWPCCGPARKPLPLWRGTRLAPGVVRSRRRQGALGRLCSLLYGSMYVSIFVASHGRGRCTRLHCSLALTRLPRLWRHATLCRRPRQPRSLAPSSTFPRRRPARRQRPKISRCCRRG